ncbi:MULTISPECIES: type II secretion system minor pseudopilin GspJ [Acinetobacter calcoaceticus/baumannii complex]|uniref:type II secretion system minor pseudopilin GspJ n=1 Tax=Acinetobacter calcoaceticus/baumannii complex TaxID=909768 RepID=UPI0004B62205|nr:MULTISPECIES: type II secretion system minor pseudopilin GspJ [Acinetobacter calcoaceticus/baumannii complex]AJB48441.1 general secretion pathway protein GspJ [Acinetobacter nosocomialis]MBJ9961729.1 type II secretion system minor pseudopilin GspJ [Acinetobacter nosocomialis]MBR7738679.1 type II secretion system minor pseudopilin GspJ [Acinetobacter nosocomialis]MBR7748787.1 type II secretion system minor pseudopilin GspJ [Acinetobacter nosocomialis]MDO7216603.1 type II secretion system min
MIKNKNFRIQSIASHLRAQSGVIPTDYSGHSSSSYAQTKLRFREPHTRNMVSRLAARSGGVSTGYSEHSSSSCAWTKLRFVNPRSGFTLVELLVAIAIFAVLSLLGWKIFDYLLKVRDRNAEHEVHLFELQDAYQQILRDSLQIIPLSANQGGQLHPALEIDNQILRFSKAGVTDPLKLGLSPFERIEYRYDADQKKLYRLKYTNLNTSNNEQPLSSTLLSQVDQYQIMVLTPQEITKWPEVNIDPTKPNELKKLPKGIKIQLTVAGVSYEWIYSLNQSNLSLSPQGGS